MTGLDGLDDGEDENGEVGKERHVALVNLQIKESVDAVKAHPLLNSPLLLHLSEQGLYDEVTLSYSQLVKKLL